MALSNSQYNAVMRIYNQRQFLNKREQDARLSEVYGKIPQIEALTDEIAADMAEAGRCLIKGDRAGAERLKNEAARLKEQKLLYLRRNGYPDDYLDMHYRCPDCRDTGYADGKKCHCFRKMEIDILYDQSNIREVLERENFDTLTMEYYDRERIDEKTGMTVYDYMSEVIRECRSMWSGFPKKKAASCLPGIRAAGRLFKQLHCQELILRCFSVVYLTATDLFDILSESRFSRREEQESSDRAAYILECDLLIIDDLGTELINTFTSSQLFYCINERLNRKKGTIISTNLTPGRLQDEFTERVASRILNQYKILPLLGDDVRALRRGYRLG